jgi:hypothetical protein
MDHEYDKRSRILGAASKTLCLAARPQTRIMHNPQRQPGRLPPNQIPNARISLVLDNPFAAKSNVLADAAGYDFVADCF